MEFALATDQEQLQREARTFLEDRYPIERVVELAESDAGWDPFSWPELAELGWLGVTVPEERGGIGLSFVEQAILFEELGRALYPGPYFTTIALALPALPEVLHDEIVAGAARWSVEVNGLVPDLDKVTRVLAEDFGVLRAYPVSGELFETMDATRPYGRLTPGGNGEEIAGVIDLTRAFVALAAEAVGIAQRVLELSIEHANTRQQFGKAIGIYQAIAHPLADAYVETEMSRSLAYAAAWSVDNDAGEAPIAAAAAKAFAAETAVRACERAIQVHGGIGFTWEHPLHRFYKRAQWIESFGGFPAAQRARVAASLLD
jgi:alkylation response protein AidB-like acyl-CoA dehydrogenase